MDAQAELLAALLRALRTEGFEADTGPVRTYAEHPDLVSVPVTRAGRGSTEWLHVLAAALDAAALARLMALSERTRGRPSGSALLHGIQLLATPLPVTVVSEQRPTPPGFSPLAEVHADRPLDWRDLAARMMPICDGLAELAVPGGEPPITHGDLTAEDLYIEHRTGLVWLGGFVRGALARRPGDPPSERPGVRAAEPDTTRLIDILEELGSPPAGVVQRWRAAVEHVQGNPHVAALALEEVLGSAQDEDGTVVDEDVQFSLYRPDTIVPGRWHPFLAFAHKTDLVDDGTSAVVDPVEQVEAQARALLATENTPYRTVRTDSGTALGRGADLTFELWLDGAEVNPPRAQLSWQEPVHRVEFRVRATTAVAGSRLNGGLRVFSAHLLIAETGFSVRVGQPDQSAPVPDASPDIAVSSAEQLTPEPVHRYRKIFASYSHRDGDVVAAVRRYTEVTGDRYLIDSETLRSGETWSDRLAQLIEEADVFQLFWSHHSMGSPHVRREWEHALSLRREQFVRPVYWEDPFPEDPAAGLPPEDLLVLHFSSLSPAPVVGPGSVAAHTDGSVTTTICGVCGQSVRLDAKFCVHCGTLMRGVAAPSVAEPEPVFDQASWQAPSGPAAPVQPAPAMPPPMPPPMDSLRSDAARSRGPRMLQLLALGLIVAVVVAVIVAVLTLG
jgi:TIR domain